MNLYTATIEEVTYVVFAEDESGAAREIFNDLPPGLCGEWPDYIIERVLVKTSTLRFLPE